MRLCGAWQHRTRTPPPHPAIWVAARVPRLPKPTARSVSDTAAVQVPVSKLEISARYIWQPLPSWAESKPTSLISRLARGWISTPCIWMPILHPGIAAFRTHILHTIDVHGQGRIPPISILSSRVATQFSSWSFHIASRAAPSRHRSMHLCCQPQLEQSQSSGPRFPIDEAQADCRRKRRIACGWGLVSRWCPAAYCAKGPKQCLSLDPIGHDALYEVFLREEKEQQNRQHDKQGGRHQQVPALDAIATIALQDAQA